jgi:hypothetical protein
MDRNDVLRLLSTPVNAPAASFPIHSRSASRWCASLDPVAPQIPRHDH